MVIVDTFLRKMEAEGKKIRVGLWGAGEMAQGFVNQVMRYTPAMEVTVIANRTLQKAIDAYTYAGYSPVICNDLSSVEQAIQSNQLVVTENAELLCEADGLDILVECTGTIHFAANLVWKAIHNKKNVLMFNPEIDATIGPILKYHADQHGVLLSGAEGDQPGVTMNLYRFVRNIGLTPLLCGNIKGLQDFYRNPTTQAGFAARWRLTPEMVTQFADGTKISFEQTCVANATGMRLLKRGMTGIHYDGHIDDMTSMYDVEELRKKGGVVDYVVGPKPGPGVFVFATTDDEKTKHYLDYGKLGTGPLYSFYTPYHLIFFELPFSVARMVIFRDVILTPLAGPVVEVITHAKTPLKAGTTLDGLGGYCTYGQCEEAEIVQRERLLPIGLAEGAILKRDLQRDEIVTFDDVLIDEEALVMRLYRQQQELFFSGKREPVLSDIALIQQ